jgi:hypothetical protein
MDPRAFCVIPAGRKKMTKKEKKDHAKIRRDDLIAKHGHPKENKNAG